jgi:hypothetical protein
MFMLLGQTNFEQTIAEKLKSAQPESIKENFSM